MPADLRVVAVAREPLTTTEYRDLVGGRLERHAPDLPASCRDDVLARLDYHEADLDGAPSLAAVGGPEPVIAYLALPPARYPAAVRALRAAGIHPDSRIAVEKPFGRDGRSATELTELLHATVPEHGVFRVDHFLHHQTVQTLLSLRLANRLLEPLWCARHVERVDITWEETTGVGTRGDFYDGTGALRDMVQSHLLQLLAVVAMDLPATLDERSLRDAKAATLRAVRPPAPEDLARDSVRGVYTAGRAGGRVGGRAGGRAGGGVGGRVGGGVDGGAGGRPDVGLSQGWDGGGLAGYADLPGVDPARGTETYAALRLGLDTERWSGVPFVVRTGKALGEDRRSVAVRFRAPDAVPGFPSPAGGGVLRVEMVPERVSLELSSAGPEGFGGLVPLSLVAQPPRPSLPPSARLLLDLLRGDPTLSVRDDEAQECWRVVDAVLAGWRTGAVPLRLYPAGSAGPVPAGWPPQ